MSIFTKIMDGEIPALFVWQDELCVVFATIEPVEPGHVLVIPRQEVDKYSDLAPEIFSHLMQVSQIIGKAQELAFGVPRAIVEILGFDVPHTHVHVIPATRETLAKHGLTKVTPLTDLAEPIMKLRAALVELGYQKQVPVNIEKLS